MARINNDFFEYKSDNGKSYKMLQDKTNGLTVGNVQIGDSSFPKFEKQWQQRHINCEAILTPKAGVTVLPLVIKRRIPIGDRANTLYVSGGTVTLTVDNASNTEYEGITITAGKPTAVFSITGAVGEHRTDPIQAYP